MRVFLFVFLQRRGIARETTQTPPQAARTRFDVGTYVGGCRCGGGG